jgi:serine/threonine-protein kinase
MARVWRAMDRTLRRAVAVKFMFLREGRDRRTMIDRFLREARIAAAVRHANVVDILDFGTTEDGSPFMVMELLEGESLQARLAREPALGLGELVAIAAGVLDGLGAVHRAGIVHRDLKPENVFLVDEGGEVRPKLLDFGVSRETDTRSGRRSALTTSDGHLVGTPEYMSPEQARGLPDVDWRSDLYSMGVVLYEALTGQLPYRCDAVGDLIIEIVGGNAPTVAAIRPELGEALSDVIARAMYAKREDRFQSAREMRDALLAATEATLREGGPLAAIVPARSARSDRRRLATPSTLDGIGLPWGQAAVPSFDGGIVDKPVHWTVDTALPPARPRWGPRALAVLVIPLAGIGTWYVLRGAAAPPPSPPTPVVAAPARAPEERAPADAPAPQVREPIVHVVDVPETPELEHVTVRLRDLPPRARVRVDGALVRPDDGMLTLPRDGRAHPIVVTAPGLHGTWRATHTAERDGDYRVRLRQAAAREGPSGVFRDLDY